MRPLYDDFDEFDFADNAIVKQMLREQAREQRRLATRRKHGPGSKRKRGDEDTEDFADYENYEEYNDYDDNDYDDYDPDEFDRY